MYKALISSVVFAFSLSFHGAALANPLNNNVMVKKDAWENEDDWGDDAWGDEAQVSPWQFSGFLAAGYGRFTQTNIVHSSQALNELTARLDLDYSHKLFEFSAKADAKYDDVLSKAVWDTREFNIAFSPLSNVDIKLGRQVLTWGTGDYVFLNDLFAKDWRSFFSGRDDEYLKSYSDSVRSTWYLSDYSIDLGWTPAFTPDNYITGQRFSFYSPLTQMQVAPAEWFAVKTTDKDQFSLRIATSRDGIEYALYGYKGFWPTPQGMQSNNHTMTAYFPKLRSWGASVRMTLGAGLFNAEYAAYNSIEDSLGANPMIANSQGRFLLGYETELLKDLTASAQLYIEKTKGYSNFIATHPTPSLAVDEYRTLATMRLTYMTMQQKLIYSLFTFYSPSDKDGYIKPAINYRYSDQLNFALGANLFFGNDDHSFFGQHQVNSNVWLRTKVNF